jgi:protein ImuB
VSGAPTDRSARADQSGGAGGAGGASGTGRTDQSGRPGRTDQSGRPGRAEQTPRIACLLVPDLPLRAELRAHPELANQSVVIASGTEPSAHVISLSPEAMAAGVPPHSSVTRSRAICPELAVRVASPALERAARETLLDVALSFSPRAMAAPRAGGSFVAEAAVFLDASGVASLFQSESGFASALAERARSQGLPGVVSIAASRSVALLAARATENAIQILAPGEEESFLLPLPIDLLDPEDELAESLTRFGVRRVRDLLRLPRRGLAQRLGPNVLNLLARARGKEVEAPLPERSDLRLEEAIDLEYPVDRLEPLLFVLRGLVARLLERLSLRGLVCGPLDLELGLANGGRHALRVGLAAPTADVRVLLRLISLSLESSPLQDAIQLVSLATEGSPARSDQLDLFLPRGPDPAALDRTLSELESLCGSDRVGSPQVPDDHRPDTFAQKPFHPTPKPKKNSERRLPNAHKLLGTATVRALRPPVSAEVRVAGGQPSSIRCAVSSGEIVRVAGPWRTTGRWWSEKDRFALDYFDVQVTDGTVLRLRFDWRKRRWQVDGLYD